MRRVFMKGLAILLIGGLLTCPGLAASAFPDVEENSDYAEAVTYVSELGIMVGDENGNFNPNKMVTRAEMATILCNMVGESGDIPVDGSIFTDVPANHWANPYVIRAAELGLVNGYGNGLYGPSDILTYEQAITMIVRAIGNGDEATDLGGYPDGFIASAESDGLLANMSAGVGDKLSRSNIATILFNYYNASIPV